MPHFAASDGRRGRPLTLLPFRRTACRNARIQRPPGIRTPTPLRSGTVEGPSAALGLTNVPTFFHVGPDGRIVDTAVGFQRPMLEKFARRAGRLAGRSRVRLFPIGEMVPLIVPG